MILEILIITLFVCGFKLSIQDGYVLDDLGRLLKKIAPEKYLISAPLWKCIVCMNSIWGTLIYWLVFHSNDLHSWSAYKEWLVVIFCCVPVTAFIHDRLKEWYE